MKSILSSLLLIVSATAFAQDYTTCLAGHCESSTITVSELAGVSSIEVNQVNPETQVVVSSFVMSVGSKTCSSESAALSSKCIDRLKSASIGDEIKIYDIVVVVDEPIGLNAKASELVLTVVDNP